MLRRLCILVLSLLTAAAVVSVGRLPALEDEASSPPPASGLRVVMDPATGEIVSQPTARQLAASNRALAWDKDRSSWDLRRFELSGGGQGVALDGWATHTMRVERDEAGTLRLVCARGDSHRGEE